MFCKFAVEQLTVTVSLFSHENVILLWGGGEGDLPSLQNWGGGGGASLHCRTVCLAKQKMGWTFPPFADRLDEQLAVTIHGDQ